MKLIIKPEFDEKLKQHRAKTKFLNNFKRYQSDPEESLDPLNEYIDFRDFIIHAFHWRITPEGFDYWYEISLK